MDGLTGLNAGDICSTKAPRKDMGTSRALGMLSTWGPRATVSSAVLRLPGGSGGGLG